MFLRYIVFGNRQQTGNARLGGDQVIVAVVQPPVIEIVADMEDFALRVIEKAEIHLQHQLISLSRQSRGIV